MKEKYHYEEIANGALILLLLRENKTMEEIGKWFEYIEPIEPQNTAAYSLVQKLFEMRDLKLIDFKDEEIKGSRWPVGEIVDTTLWSKIRVAFGGMSAHEAALISRTAKGIAVAPEFGRPTPPPEKINVFVLMPFKAEMEKVYTNHLKKAGEELGLTIRRADEIFSPGPFMKKIWDGICAAQLILADCTEKNPNVFYEIGLAHTVGKKVVLLTRSHDDIPSDIKHMDYILYTYDPEGVGIMIDRLKKILKSHFCLE